MVAIEIQNNLIINQLGNTAGILPVDAQTDIALAKLIKVVIHNNVGTALQTIFYKFLDAAQLFFSHLRHILAQRQSILAEISIKILCLVKFPVEFLELHPVL